jgi:hypothetical protein
MGDQGKLVILLERASNLDKGDRFSDSDPSSWLLRSSATVAACLRRPTVVVVESAQHREGHDAPALGVRAAALPLVRDPLPDPLVRSTSVWPSCAVRFHGFFSSANRLPLVTLAASGSPVVRNART